LLRENPEHLGHDQVIELQRTVGNTATQRLLRGGETHPSQPIQRHSGILIQRMPTSAVVENTLGKPKKDRKTFGKVKLNSTKYKAVLDALRTFEAYTVSNFLAQDPSSLRDQMTQVNRLLQAVYNAMNKYAG